MVSMQQASLEEEEQQGTAELPLWPLLDRLPQSLARRRVLRAKPAAR